MADIKVKKYTKKIIVKVADKNVRVNTNARNITLEQVGRRGPGGEQGIQGVPGIDGPPGPIGATGPTGAVGPPGTTDYNGLLNQPTIPDPTTVAANTSARHTHANKVLLDTYTQTEANLADAVVKKHTPVDISGKQDTLVSGTSIKTVNSTSLLGSGDIVIGGAVDSVNTQTGAVVLNTDDIAEGTNKYVTSAEKTILSNTSGVNTGDQDISGIATNASNITNKVSKAGDTMTGNLYIEGGDTTEFIVGNAGATYNDYIQTFRAVKEYKVEWLWGSRTAPDSFLALSLNLGNNYWDNKVRDFIMQSTAASNSLFVKASNGYVGIGTATPSERLTINGNASPSANVTNNLGSSSNYWLNTYTQKLYLNSTASLDGSTAGKMVLNGQLQVNTSNQTSLEMMSSAQYAYNYFRNTKSYSTNNYNNLILTLKASNGSDQIVMGYLTRFNDTTLATLNSSFRWLGFANGTYATRLEVDGNKLYISTETIANDNLYPGTNISYNLGTSSAYWLNTYTQKLYLNSTAYLDGSTAGQINLTGNLALSGADTTVSLTGVTTEPSAPSTGQLKIYSKKIAGKMFPKTVGPSGIDSPLQNAFWQNNICIWQPTTASNGLWLGTAPAAAGTYATVLPTSTSLYTAMKRGRWSNIATTANQVLTQRSLELMYFLGNSAGMGGFFFYTRMGFDTWTDGGRLFAGLFNGNSLIQSDPSTVDNNIGFAVDVADNGLIYFQTKGTGAAVRTSTGFTITSGSGYDMYIFAAPNSTTVSWRILEINTGTEATGSSAVSGPAVNVMMMAGIQASNAALTSVNAIQLCINRIYVETDR
jgi:hypothetical protein